MVEEKKLEVLVVEDEKESFMKLALPEISYILNKPRIEIAPTYKDAIKYLEKKRPDGVITDLSFPLDEGGEVYVIPHKEAKETGYFDMTLTVARKFIENIIDNDAYKEKIGKIYDAIEEFKLRGGNVLETYLKIRNWDDLEEIKKDLGLLSKTMYDGTTFWEVSCKSYNKLIEDKVIKNSDELNLKDWIVMKELGLIASDAVYGMPKYIGNLIALECKKKGIPYVIATQDYSHSSKGIEHGLLLGTIDPDQFIKRVEEISKTDVREYLKDGMVITDTLVLGDKTGHVIGTPTGSSWILASKVLKEKLGKE